MRFPGELGDPGGGPNLAINNILDKYKITFKCSGRASDVAGHVYKHSDKTYKCVKILNFIWVKWQCILV